MKLLPKLHSHFVKAQLYQPKFSSYMVRLTFSSESHREANGAPSFLQPLIHAMPLYYLNEALHKVIYSGAGWSAIQTGMLVMLAWIVASMLVVGF
jgi:hypothetical protein